MLATGDSLCTQVEALLDRKLHRIFVYLVPGKQFEQAGFPGFSDFVNTWCDMLIAASSFMPA